MTFSNTTTLNFSIENRTLQLSQCAEPQTFITFDEFFMCFKYFFQKYSLQAVLEILLCIGTVVVNSLVILLISLKPKKKLFDQIMIGQSK